MIGHYYLFTSPVKGVFPYFLGGGERKLLSAMLLKRYDFTLHKYI